MVLNYQITLKEHLDDSWSSWFDGLTITHGTDGTTTLKGSIRDQSALYGLIDKARDLGLTLVAVRRSNCHRTASTWLPTRAATTSNSASQRLPGQRS